MVCNQEILFLYVVVFILLEKHAEKIEIFVGFSVRVCYGNKIYSFNVSVIFLFVFLLFSRFKRTWQ